jgi:hypothetical protein
LHRTLKLVLQREIDVSHQFEFKSSISFKGIPCGVIHEDKIPRSECRDDNSMNIFVSPYSFFTFAEDGGAGGKCERGVPHDL